MQPNTSLNVDSAEIEKFNRLAKSWWDPNSEFKPLHEINPLRINFINQATPLVDRKILDVGCGGGLLTEGLAHRGAKMTGIDMAPTSLAIARQHAEQQNLAIDYHQTTVEDWAKEHAGHYDIITCLEMLEHVPNPTQVVNACAQLVKPGGHLFFSTINRNPKAFLFAIIGAEYILKLLPKGTHEYGKFIRPAELGHWARMADLTLQSLIGMTYNPLTKIYALTDDVSVNYLMHFQKAM